MAGGVTRRVAGVVPRGKRRGKRPSLGDQALSLGCVAVKVEELLQAVDRRLRSALDRTDNSLGEVLNLVDSAVELVNRSRGAQHFKR